MKKFDVTGIGGVTVDHLNVVDVFPEKDQKTIPLRSSLQGGGQAANAIACLARLGAKTAMIGTVGEGQIGQYAIDTLKDEGVETGCIVQQKGKSPALSSIIIEEATGARTIIADRGEVKDFIICDENYDLIENSRIVHSDAHFPEQNIELLKYAKEKGVKICVDSEPHTPHSEKFVEYADYLIVSRKFVEDKFNKDYEKALFEFVDMGAEIAVVTLGKYGACGMVKGDKKCLSIPSFDVEPVVDTTGAGDAFHGAFLYGLLQNWDFKKNMMFATVVAGLKCKKIGGRLGLPTLQEALDALETWKI